MIAALDPTQFPEPPGEFVSELPFNCVIDIIPDCADAPYPFGLLRPRHQRPRRRAAEPRDELPPFH
jgi:hypothetical protein